MAAPVPHSPHLASRVLASVLGAYVFSWGFSALLQGAGAKFGFEDAYFLAELLNFVVFFLAFLWAYAARSLALLWCAFGCGGATMAGVAWLLTHS